MFRQYFRNRNRLAVCMILTCIITVLIMGGSYYFRTQPKIRAGNTVANTGTSNEASLYTDEDETDVGYEPQLTESISANTDTTTAIPTTVLQTTQSTTQSTTQATTQATASVASYSYNRAMEAEVLVLINKYRTDAGLAALSSETTIQSWSDLRATEIVSQGIAAGNSVLAITHIRPNGSNPWGGYQGAYTYFGENIAGGLTTAEAVVTQWMNSPGHKENIMNGNFTTVGISCICNDGVYYWVQDFVGS